MLPVSAGQLKLRSQLTLKLTLVKISISGEFVHLDRLVGASDEGDEERQHHVDEHRDEGVEVGPAEVPHQAVLVLELREGGEHVVAIQQREQALRHATQLLELQTEEDTRRSEAVKSGTDI